MGKCRAAFDITKRKNAVYICLQFIIDFNKSMFINCDARRFYS